MSKLVATPIALVLVLGFIAAWIWVLPHGQRINHDVYQAVYLTNGQAYFGKLQNTGGEYLVLEAPYTVQNVQTDTKKKGHESQTTLLKVKDQVYGPDDSVAFRSESVLFWQNLRKDSKVQQAIEAKNR